MKRRLWSRYRTTSLTLLFALSLLPPAAATAQQAWQVHDDLFSVTFPDDTHGWACGRFGTILHTTDGGATWSRQASPTRHTLSSIHFTDPKNGWAAGSKGTLVHTSDGGGTWALQESPVDFYHMDVHFLTPSKGFVVSERTHILATEDGGATWEVRFQDEDYILKSISFCDALHGWTVGEFGYTYRTRDGGKTWEKQAGFYDLDYETGYLLGDDFLFDVTAVDPRTAWAVGILGTVKMTDDGGETWRKVDLGLPKVQLYAVASDGAGRLVIAGQGLCRVSADRGSTWKEAVFEPTIRYGWLYDVEALGSGRFTACGDEGAIYGGAAGSPWLRVRY